MFWGIISPVCYTSWSRLLFCCNGSLSSRGFLLCYATLLSDLHLTFAAKRWSKALQILWWFVICSSSLVVGSINGLCIRMLRLIQISGACVTRFKIPLLLQHQPLNCLYGREREKWSALKVVQMVYAMIFFYFILMHGLFSYSIIYVAGFHLCLHVFSVEHHCNSLEGAT